MMLTRFGSVGVGLVDVTCFEELLAASASLKLVSFDFRTPIVANYFDSSLNRSACLYLSERLAAL